MSGIAGIEVTGLASSSGPLTKRISLAPDGRLVSDGSACVMNRGIAQRVRLDGVVGFADLIGRLSSTEAIALGSLRPDLPDKVEIMTTRRLAEANGSAPPFAISRTAGHIGYVPQAPALALLDFDTKGMPEAVADRLTAHGGFWPALVAVAPELAHAARVVRRSTSSGIARGDTGEPMKGSDGQHVFLHVRDGGDVERFLKTLHDRCWLRGLGWMMVGAGGQFLDRSIVDRMVFAAERIVFEGAPILLEPLVQDAGLRAPIVTEGCQVDTVTACRALTLVEQAMDYRIELTTTQPHFGGIRWWFVCPASGRRVRCLHSVGHCDVFAGRQFLRLGYAGQRESWSDQRLRAARVADAKLGGDGCLMDRPPAKPKWMRWPTYYRLVQERDRANLKSLISALAAFDTPGAREIVDDARRSDPDLLAGMPAR